jgi:hypothetical protein
LGCKNIHELPEVAEEAMWDYFYVFFFEVETIVVSGDPNLKIYVYVDSYRVHLLRGKDSTKVLVCSLVKNHLYGYFWWSVWFSF